MPNPVFSDVHVSAALSNIATAYVQDEADYVADKVFPVVPVVHQTDVYFKWRKDDWFRDEAAIRPDATESVGTGLNLDQGTYAAKVWALHQDVGDQVRRNQDPAVDLDVAVTKSLMQKMLISRDNTFMAKYITTGIWGTDITGATSAGATTTVYWNDDANGDPISDIETAKLTIKQNTGQDANVLLLGYQVFLALKKHPLIIDRIKITPGPGAYDTKDINEALLARLFGVDRIVVSRAVYNTAKETSLPSAGGTSAGPTMTFIMGKHAFLCHAAPAPGLMVPTAGYIFAWQGYSGQATMGIQVTQLPVPLRGKNTVRTEVEMSFDMQTVGTDLGYFFSGIVQ